MAGMKGTGRVRKARLEPAVYFGMHQKQEGLRLGSSDR